MRFIILIVIITMAVVVGVGLLWMAGGQKPPAQVNLNTPQVAAQVATVDVLVARDAIPLGTTITAGMVDTQPFPSNLVLSGYIVAGSPEANVIGSVARGDFQSREPLIVTKLTSKEDGSVLAASLPKGMRAVTVAVDAISGVAGYIFPGDRVDILLTHGLGSSEPGVGGMGGGAANAEVMLADVRVLAVNTRRNPVQPSGQPGAGGMPESVTNMTLEMSQEDAKRLRLAERNGTLSLALRSTQDKEDQDKGVPVALSDITQVPVARKAASVAPAAAPVAAPARNGVNILRGGINGGGR